MKSLSPTVTALPASAATAVNYQIKARRSAGHDVVSFCVGEPDFDTPASAAVAGVRAIEQGFTRYTDPAGAADARQAVAEAMARDYALHYAPQQIAITTGAKYAVTAAVAAMTEPGDEFLIPTPGYPSYGPIVKLCGARAVFVPCPRENGFKLTAAALRQSCTALTKALILNNPCNPTGALYSRTELEALLEVCRETDIYVISDEVYSRLTYDGQPFCAAASVSEDALRRTVTVNGASKTYAMTGWRLGWVCADKSMIDAITVYLNHTTGCPSAIAQAAAVAALRGGQEDTERMRKAYERRRDLLLPALRSLGLPCETPRGAFYIMASVENCGYASSRDFALALLEREDVAVVPCEDYGAPGYVRLAYTLSEERIQEGLRRLAHFLGRTQA